jgi:hypothetical protein
MKDALRAVYYKTAEYHPLIFDSLEQLAKQP